MPNLPPSDAKLDGRLRLIVSSYQRLTGKALIVVDSPRPQAGAPKVGNPLSGKPDTELSQGLGEREVSRSFDISTLSLTTPAGGTPVGAPPLRGDPSAVPLQGGGDIAALREALWNAPRAIVAHGTEDDPIFFYGNRLALQMFEMSFDEFARLPSRASAEPLAQEARVKLLEKVTQQGYVDGYSGVRIARSGRRFMITDTTVWNLADENGLLHGQAAVFVAKN